MRAAGEKANQPWKTGPGTAEEGMFRSLRRTGGEHLLARECLGMPNL